MATPKKASFKQLKAGVVKADPLELQLREAEQFIQANELPSAAAALNAAAKAAPNDPRVHLVGIYLAEAAKNPKAALQSAVRAAELAPNWAPAMIELAAVLSRQNEHTEALQCVADAIKLAPKDMRVLELATSVANRAGHYELASGYLQQAKALQPGQPMLDRAIAENLYNQKKLVEARPLFDGFVKTDKADEWALAGRAYCALKLDDLDTAKADYKALIKAHPINEQYAYFGTIANGETPLTQPAAMVASIFDAYASYYDKREVGVLKYSVPKRVAEIILAHYPDAPIDVLDLGCGTGLLAVYLGRPQGALAGVEISTNMTAEALKHRLYDRIHTVNVLDALDATPEAQYDVIAACDLFPYVGDMSKAIPDAHRILRAGGRFIFSCDTAKKNETALTLRSDGRYAHKLAGLKTACKKAGFVDIESEEIIVREEDGVPSAGFIVTAKKVD